MNIRQIAITWIAATFFIPAAYFSVRHGVALEYAVRENHEIIAGREEKRLGLRKFRVQDHMAESGEIIVYEVLSDRFPDSDAEIEKLISTGRKLTQREAQAWLDRERLKKQRRFYWEIACTVALILVSFTSLLVFLARDRKFDKAADLPKGAVTPGATEGASK